MSEAASKNVLRVDEGDSVRKYSILDNGYLLAPANLTRTGVFEYRRGDGTVRRELRLPEEVFNADSLASFRLVPLTNDHPMTGRLDAANTKDADVIGTVGQDVAAADPFVAAHVMVTDADAIERIRNGVKSQLSCGYTCDLEDAPGVYQGAAYDCVQRNIRGNHVALVTKGRAGGDCRVRLDNDDAIGVTRICNVDDVPDGDHFAMTKINLDGIDFEVSDPAAQAFRKALESAKAEAEKAAGIADATKAELEKVKGHADAAEDRAKKAEAALAVEKDPAKRRDEIRARVQLEATAGKFLGEAVKVDGMSDLEIKAAVIKKLSPDASLDGKSPEYVTARFDAAVETAGAVALAQARRTVEAPRTDAVDANKPASLAEAQAKFNAALDNAYRRNRQ